MKVLNVNTGHSLDLTMENPKSAAILMFLAMNMDENNKVILSENELKNKLFEAGLPKSHLTNKKFNEHVRFLIEENYLSVEIGDKVNTYTISKEIYFLSEDSDN